MQSVVVVCDKDWAILKAHTFVFEGVVLDLVGALLFLELPSRMAAAFSCKCTSRSWLRWHNPEVLQSSLVSCSEKMSRLKGLCNMMC